MAFPTTSVLDTGTRADESPATGWTDGPDGGTYGGVKIASNQIAPISGDAWDYYGTTDYGPDSEVYATDPASTAAVQLFVRQTPLGSSAIDGYAVQRNSSTAFRFYREDNDVDTQLGANVSQANAAGDSWGGEMIGSTLTLYYKSGAGAWTSLGTRSDATYSAAGRLTVYHATATSRLTNFGGGTVVVASSLKTRKTLMGVGI